MDHDAVDDGSILLFDVANDDLWRSDFMFETPQFVEGMNDYGSWDIVGWRPNARVRNTAG